MSMKNIARMAIGFCWGLLVYSVFAVIGEQSEATTYTVLDAFLVIGFLIVIAVLSVITFAAAIDDN